MKLILDRLLVMILLLAEITALHKVLILHVEGSKKSFKNGDKVNMQSHRALISL